MNTNPTNYVPHDPIQTALIDPGNYHDQENWFRLLQEDGIGFTKLDACHWGENSIRKRVDTLLSSVCTTNNFLHWLKSFIPCTIARKNHILATS